MGEISFYYGDHIKKAAKLFYFKSLKIILIYLLEGFLFLLCLILSILHSSLILFAVSMGLILAMFSAYLSETIIIPNKLIQVIDGKVKRKVIITFNSNGVERQTVDSHTKVSWTHFNKVWENKDYYLLFNNNKQYWIVPKIAFIDSSEEDKFRTYILNHHKITSGITR